MEELMICQYHIIAIVQRDGDIISFASSDQHDVKGAYTRLHRI